MQLHTVSICWSRRLKSLQNYNWVLYKPCLIDQVSSISFFDKEYKISLVYLNQLNQQVNSI